MGYFDENIYNQVVSGSNFGYEGAQQYYANLRNKLIKSIQLILNTQGTELSKKIIQNKLLNIENEIQTKSRAELMQSSQEELQKLVDWVESMLSGNSGKLQSLIQDTGNKLAQVKKDYKNNSNKLSSAAKKSREELNNFIKEKGQHENILMAITKNKQYVNNPDYNSLVNFMEGYLMRVVRWKAEGVSDIFISPKDTAILAGYLKEVVEKEALVDLFKKLQIVDVSPDLIAGKNEIVDILLPFSNLKNIEGQGEEEIDFLQDFGIQSKLADITKYSNAEFFKISHSAKLRDQFNQGMTLDKEHEYQWTAGVAFLGKKARILQVLGEKNVMFFSGDNRYFMDSFIQQFRANGRYLAFEFDDEHKATSQIGLQAFEKKI